MEFTWNLTFQRMFETKESQGVLDKPFTKVSLSDSKGGPWYNYINLMNQIAVKQDEIIRATLSRK